MVNRSLSPRRSEPRGGRIVTVRQQGRGDGSRLRAPGPSESRYPPAPAIGRARDSIMRNPRRPPPARRAPPPFARLLLAIVGLVVVLMLIFY
ncbi:hypothetical protein GCM10011322_01210 [Salinarimonas ramus]|uniref:Uncharacterized protein n=1 Tax=Salinarimonas ramus TaxID=690164 RepID=A0A917V1X7_9HYPH|nr:hypothetical protein GCM10011322_01210 [Salinarimonas ramus]